MAARRAPTPWPSLGLAFALSSPSKRRRSQPDLSKIARKHSCMFVHMRMSCASRPAFLGLVPMPRGMPDPMPRQIALGTRCPTRSSSTGAASTGASPSSAPTASASRGTTEAEAPPSTRALPGAFTLAAAARCILPGPSPLQLDHQRAGRLANRVQRGAAQGAAGRGRRDRDRTVAERFSLKPCFNSCACPPALR